MDFRSKLEQPPMGVPLSQSVMDPNMWRSLMLNPGLAIGNPGMDVQGGMQYVPGQGQYLGGPADALRCRHSHNDISSGSGEAGSCDDVSIHGGKVGHQLFDAAAGMGGEGGRGGEGRAPGSRLGGASGGRPAVERDVMLEQHDSSCADFDSSSVGEITRTARAIAKELDMTFQGLLLGNRGMPPLFTSSPSRSPSPSPGTGAVPLHGHGTVPLPGMSQTVTAPYGIGATGVPPWHPASIQLPGQPSLGAAPLPYGMNPMVGFGPGAAVPALPYLYGQPSRGGVSMLGGSSMGSYFHAPPSAIALSMFPNMLASAGFPASGQLSMQSMPAGMQYPAQYSQPGMVPSGMLYPVPGYLQPDGTVPQTVQQLVPSNGSSTAVAPAVAQNVPPCGAACTFAPAYANWPGLGTMPGDGLICGMPAMTQQLQIVPAAHQVRSPSRGADYAYHQLPAHGMVEAAGQLPEDNVMSGGFAPANNNQHAGEWLGDGATSLALAFDSAANDVRQLAANLAGDSDENSDVSTDVSSVYDPYGRAYKASKQRSHSPGPSHSPGRQPSTRERHSSRGRGGHVADTKADNERSSRGRGGHIADNVADNERSSRWRGGHVADNERSSRGRGSHVADIEADNERSGRGRDGHVAEYVADNERSRGRGGHVAEKERSRERSRRHVRSKRRGGSRGQEEAGEKPRSRSPPRSRSQIDTGARSCQEAAAAVLSSPDRSRGPSPRSHKRRNTNSPAAAPRGAAPTSPQQGGPDGGLVVPQNTAAAAVGGAGFQAGMQLPHQWDASATGGLCRSGITGQQQLQQQLGPTQSQLSPSPSTSSPAHTTHTYTLGSDQGLPSSRPVQDPQQGSPAHGQSPPAPSSPNRQFYQAVHGEHGYPEQYKPQQQQYELQHSQMQQQQQYGQMQQQQQNNQMQQPQQQYNQMQQQRQQNEAYTTAQQQQSQLYHTYRQRDPPVPAGLGPPSPPPVHLLSTSDPHAPPHPADSSSSWAPPHQHTSSQLSYPTAMANTGPHQLQQPYHNVVPSYHSGASQGQLPLPPPVPHLNAVEQRYTSVLPTSSGSSCNYHVGGHAQFPSHTATSAGVSQQQYMQQLPSSYQLPHASSIAYQATPPLHQQYEHQHSWRGPNSPQVSGSLQQVEAQLQQLRLHSYLTHQPNQPPAAPQQFQQYQMVAGPGGPGPAPYGINHTEYPTANTAGRSDVHRAYMETYNQLEAVYSHSLGR